MDEAATTTAPGRLPGLIAGLLPPLAMLVLYGLLCAAEIIPYMPGLLLLWLLWPLLGVGVGLVRGSAWVNGLLALATGALLAVACFAANFRAVRVEGESMLPGLQPGDVLLVDQTATPQPLGMYIIEEDEGSVAIIKRLVGMPGQTLELKYGRLFADGVEVHPRDGTAPDDWTETRPIGHSYRLSEPLHLKPGEYFFLGDNPPRSRDGRNFGAITEERIHGRAVWRLKGSGFGPVK